MVHEGKLQSITSELLCCQFEGRGRVWPCRGRWQWNLFMLFMDGTLMIAAEHRSSDGLSRDFDFCSLLLGPSATVASFSQSHPNFLVLFLAVFFFFCQSLTRTFRSPSPMAGGCEMRSSAALAVRPPGCFAAGAAGSALRLSPRGINRA